MSAKYLCSVTLGECRVLSPLLIHYFQSVSQSVSQQASSGWRKKGNVSPKQFRIVAGVRIHESNFIGFQ